MCFCDGYAGSDGKSNDGNGDDFHCSYFSDDDMGQSKDVNEYA